MAVEDLRLTGAAGVTGGDGLDAPAPPPPGSAANDFGRIAARYGFGPENLVSTSVLPPKIAVPTVTVSPSTESAVPLVITGRSSLADRRATASRPS